MPAFSLSRLDTTCCLAAKSGRVSIGFLRSFRILTNISDFLIFVNVSPNSGLKFYEK